MGKNKGRGRGRGRGDGGGDSASGGRGRGRGRAPGQNRPQQQNPPQQQQQQPQHQQPPQQHHQPPQQQPLQQQQQPLQQQPQPLQQQPQPLQQQQQPLQQQQQPLQQQPQPLQQQLQPPPQQQPPQQQQPKQPQKKQKTPKQNTEVYGSSIDGKEFQKEEEYIPLPLRPSLGTQGRKVQLVTNFFPLKIPPNTVIHQYDVVLKEGITVDDFPKKKGRCIIEKLVDDNPAMFQHRPVYNGKKIMYTKEPLNFQGTKSFNVEYSDGRKKRTYEVELTWSAQVEMKILQDAINGKIKSLPQNLINGLDIVLRHAATLKYVPMGSKFFTKNGSVNLTGGREMWPGFVVTVRPTDRWKLMLNVDVSATAFIRGVDVIEYLYDVTGYDCTQSLSPLKDYERKQFEKEIKGLKIQAMHMPSKRQYRVNSVKKQSSDKEMFEKDDKSKISVKDYFAKEKKIPLKYPWLPCLHVGNKEKTIYLPLEVCRIVDGQHCNKKLSEEQTALMIRQTARRPHERKKVVETIVNEDLNYRANPYTKDFGIQVDNRMTQVEGRIIPPPEILYAGNGRPLTPNLGAWNMKGIKVYKGAVIKAWGFVIFNRCINDGGANKFEQELVKMANSMGIQMGRSIYQRNAGTRDGPEQVVEEAYVANKDLDLLVVVLPGKTPFYANLKRLCETEVGHQKIRNETSRNLLKKNGLSTQCIQKKNALKCNPMCLAQLLLKINAKMGGINNAINDHNRVTRPMRVFNEPVMFMGADVTHPGIGNKTSPSIAAIVGSVDPWPSRYAVCVGVQKHRKEVIEDMKKITVELLKQFYRATKHKPAKIIMYRDGVSEGQFQQVLYWEMKAMQAACTSLEPDYKPAITFIVVQKRHHARFFTPNRNDQDKSGNCLPGTTIESGICHPTEYDYYQFSHAGIQGTSRPAHYHVLWDDSNFKPDELQSLSFMLSHLYVRCTRSVSIPAPAYYAHHVAFRARHHLQEVDNDDGMSSSGRSDVSEATNKMALLNFGNIAKPHPRLMHQMYFV